VTALCPNLPKSFSERLLGVKYLGMVCVVLLLRRSLSPFYVTNITQRARFTGVIEMTNLIGTETTHGYSLVYLPKYTPASDPLFSKTDDEVWQEFSLDLFRMNPTLHSSDIAARFVFRERAVQPVPTIRYSELALPSMEMPMPGVFLANTSQIVNDTLNNNVMTGIARRASEMVMQFHAGKFGVRSVPGVAGEQTAPSAFAEQALMMPDKIPEERYDNTVHLSA
jgi:hypothetical protein